MKVTLLGTGTSIGVPAIGCTCNVCLSPNAKNKRTRPSVLIQDGAQTILIDTSPDFRQQALRHGITRLNAILFTHHHADHVLGLDDIRPLNFVQKAAIPCYGSAETIHEIRITFRYIFTDNHYGGLPQITTHFIDGPFTVGRISVVPLPLMHARLPVLGFRIGGFAYLTDVSTIPEETWPLLGGVQVLVLGALRYAPHPAHFTVSEAIETVRRLRPESTYLTHLCHELDYDRANAELPAGIQLGYDGFSFEL